MSHMPPPCINKFKGVATYFGSPPDMSEKTGLLSTRPTFTVNSTGYKAYRAAAYVGRGVKSVLGLQTQKDGEKVKNSPLVAWAH